MSAVGGRGGNSANSGGDWKEEAVVQLDFTMVAKVVLATIFQFKAEAEEEEQVIMATVQMVLPQVCRFRRCRYLFPGGNGGAPLTVQGAGQ